MMADKRTQNTEDGMVSLDLVLFTTDKRPLAVASFHKISKPEKVTLILKSKSCSAKRQTKHTQVGKL